jgi:hypothetical protein
MDWIDFAGRSAASETRIRHILLSCQKAFFVLFVPFVVRRIGLPRKRKNASHNISTLNESPLHKALKKRISQAYDRFEVLADGYLIDIVRGDLFIEIQTANFSAMKKKLAALLDEHKVRLVYPIAAEKWIVRLDDEGEILGRRKSPKRGTVAHLFDELIYIPHLMRHANFSLQVLMIQSEELRRKETDGRRRWRRRGWATIEQRLLEIVERHVFETPADLMTLIPGRLPKSFTTADIAAAAGCPVELARKMAYALRAMDAIKQTGKKGNTILYKKARRR